MEFKYFSKPSGPRLFDFIDEKVSNLHNSHSKQGNQRRQSGQLPLYRNNISSRSLLTHETNQVHYNIPIDEVIGIEGSQLRRKNNHFRSNTQELLPEYQTKDKYDSREEFREIFVHLLELEQIEEKKETEPLYSNETGLDFIEEDDYASLIEYLAYPQSIQNLKIICKLNNILKSEDNKRIVAKFTDHKDKISEKNINQIIVYGSKEVLLKCEAYICQGFCLFIFSKSIPDFITNFIISVKARDSIKNLINAVCYYIYYTIDPDLDSIFLGQITDVKLNFDIIIEDYSANGLFKLNDSQIEAINKALKYKVSIVQGPPGTGKTVTLSSIVYHIDNLCRQESKNKIDYDKKINGNDEYPLGFKGYFTGSSKILVCAASNFPVFYMRQKIAEKSMRVLHVLAKAREDDYLNDPATFKYQYDKKVNEDIHLKNLRDRKKFYLRQVKEILKF